MKQYQQVIDIMISNGGFATLGYLNHKVDVSGWKTKTPFASIRRIVQDDRLFFKIKPGLWALKSYEGKVFNLLKIQDKTIEESEEFNHTYYQGLLAEIGNYSKQLTFVPNQDKNRLFLNKKLQEITTIDNIPEFTYDKILKRAKTVDVIWFNGRSFPSAFFEVEHSTDFQNFFLKFVDLQDFYSKFFIVSSDKRKKEFDQKIQFHAFHEVKDRIKFISYEDLSSWHTKTFEYHSINNLIM